MSTNPEKPKLEAALSSTPAAPAKKSRFRPTFRSPRIPRETKLGLGIIFSLVCVFGYVLYSRLTRPAEMDVEQFAAQSHSTQSKSVLAPSVTSDQPTALAAQAHTLTAQPGHQPTMLPGTVPQQTQPVAHAEPAPQYGLPNGGAGQTAWTPNSSNGPSATAGSDPFMNRGNATATNNGGAASSFSANGFGANSNTTNSAATAATTPSYGMSDDKEPHEGPSNSFMPPADRVSSSGATAGTASLSANVAMPEATASTALPGSNALDAFNKSAGDAMNKLKQEGQTIASSGSAAQNELGKAADSASQMLNQAQQQFGQYTSSAGNNASTMLNQAGQAATQYGGDLKQEVQTQASQYTNQFQNAAQDQFKQAQNDLRSSANALVNDTTNQLRSTTESVMTKAGDSTQNLLNSATTAINGTQPLSPLPTTPATPSMSTSTASMAQPAGGYGMPAATAPRTLDQAQTVSQPLSAAGSNNGYTATQPEQPIRIPTESTAQPMTHPASMTQPNYGATTATVPNYGAATTPSYGTPASTPNYGTPPATSGTPLQFDQPSIPAAQPTPQPYNGATRTNFEQPATGPSTVARGGVQQYTVTAQDSYYSVAEKMYGNGAYNKALYEYNRRNNPAADRLQVGGAMMIPDLGTLQSQFPDLVPQAAATATINPTPLQFPR